MLLGGGMTSARPFRLNPLDYRAGMSAASDERALTSQARSGVALMIGPRGTLGSLSLRGGG
jgi:hypothetical protein